MKRLLLFLTVSISLTVSYGQLNPVQNLSYSQWYVYPNFNVCPSFNCFELSWSEPDSSVTDTLIGYNIYKNGILYRFQPGIWFGCNGNLIPGCNNNNPDWFANMPFWTTVKAVYNKDSVMSIANDSAWIQGTVMGINEVKESSNLKINPNPFIDKTTIQTDLFFKDAILTLFNSFGQQVKQTKNISGSSFNLYRDNLPSGIYIIQLLQDNKEIVIDKLVIIDN